jgi:hypothetical protein
MTFSNAIFRSFQNSKEDQATPLGSSFGLVMASLRGEIQIHTNLEPAPIQWTQKMV